MTSYILFHIHIYSCSSLFLFLFLHSISVSQTHYNPFSPFLLPPLRPFLYSHSFPLFLINFRSHCLAEETFPKVRSDKDSVYYCVTKNNYIKCRKVTSLKIKLFSNIYFIFYSYSLFLFLIFILDIILLILSLYCIFFFSPSINVKLCFYLVVQRLH